MAIKYKEVFQSRFPQALCVRDMDDDGASYNIFLSKGYRAMCNVEDEPPFTYGMSPIGAWKNACKIIIRMDMK